MRAKAAATVGVHDSEELRVSEGTNGHSESPTMICSLQLDARFITNLKERQLDSEIGALTEESVDT